jgi:hypothetical protein
MIEIVMAVPTAAENSSSAQSYQTDHQQQCYL